MRDCESVDNRPSLQETGANLDRESVVSTLFSSQPTGKKHRDNKRRAFAERWKESPKIIERKVDSAVRGEMMALEAEAEVDARNWETRNSDFAFQDINQEKESQRFQLPQASRWADQAQRDKISLYGELELRNRLFQENHARDCQEIEELKSICCEEADRARQARSDELSMQQNRNPTTVSQMMAQIRELQNNVNSFRCKRILRS